MSEAVLGVLEHLAGHRLPLVRQTGRYVGSAKGRLGVQRESVVTIVTDQLHTAFAVADRILCPADPTALRCNDVQRCELTVVDSLRRFDELLGPSGGFVLLDQRADKRVFDDGSGGVDVTTVGGPPKRCAKVRKLAGEPIVGLALPRTVPQRDDVGFEAGEVSRVRVAGLLGDGRRRQADLRRTAGWSPAS